MLRPASTVDVRAPRPGLRGSAEKRSLSLTQPLFGHPLPTQLQASSFCGSVTGLAARGGGSRPVVTVSRRGLRTVARQDIASCPLTPVVNSRGWVFPVAPLGTVASVFAIVDAQGLVQFIGFSKDLRNTLRTLLGRRPDLVHSYRAFHHAVIDQQDLLQQRTAWISELGYTPAGNGDPVEMAKWQQPVEHGSADKAQTAYGLLQAQLKAMGITEDMSPDVGLLAQGKLDVAASACNTEAALEAASKRAASGTSASRSVTMEYPGDAARGWLEKVSADVFFQNSYTTNGGHMFDVLLTPTGGASTTHRVIVGKEYPVAAQASPEDLVCMSLAWLLHCKSNMAPEGILDSGTFPAAYFNLSLVEQWWPEFGTKHKLLGSAAFWRFNRIHNYGPAAEQVDSLMLGPGHLSEPSFL